MSFEGAGQRRRKGRSDDRAQGDLVAYEDETGTATALTGDEVAPYIHTLARASSTGLAVDTAADDTPQRLLVDENGQLWVRSSGVAAAVSRYMSSALEKQAVLKTAPAFVWELRMLVTTGIAADRWLMVFDTAAAVADGAAPIWRALLPNPASLRAEVSDSLVRPFSTTTGLVLAISTTEGTLTLPASNEAFLGALYE